MPTTAHVFIATSLDGYVARADGNVDWLTEFDRPDEDYGYAAFMDSIDGLIMGRGTFDVVRRFETWPHEKPVLVASRSIEAATLPADLADRVQVSAARPEDLLDRAAETDWKRVQVDGARLVQSFLRAGLISEMTIARVPVLLGSGRLLFGSLVEDIVLSHVDTRQYPSGLVSSHYRISRHHHDQASA
ncbi:MAG: dihydrofolate reductase [Geminicoccaceae bacterium]|nr:dihydrofolate reductase [Geminicoccaceae bacterium]